MKTIFFLCNDFDASVEISVEKKKRGTAEFFSFFLFFFGADGPEGAAGAAPRAGTFQSDPVPNKSRDPKNNKKQKGPMKCLFRDQKLRRKKNI